MNRDNYSYNESEKEEIDSDYKMPCCLECGEETEQEELDENDGYCEKCFNNLI